MGRVMYSSAAWVYPPCSREGRHCFVRRASEGRRAMLTGTCCTGCCIQNTCSQKLAPPPQAAAQAASPAHLEQQDGGCEHHHDELAAHHLVRHQRPELRRRQRTGSSDGRSVTAHCCLDVVPREPTGCAVSTPMFSTSSGRSGACSAHTWPPLSYCRW